MDQTLYMASVSFKHEADLDTGRADYDMIRSRGIFYQLQADRSEAEEKLLVYLKKELSRGLWLTKVKKIQAKVHQQETMITVQTETSVSIPFLKELFDSLSYTEIKGDVIIHDPAETIRLCEVILDTGSKIKGVSELKDKVEKALSRFGTE